MCMQCVAASGPYVASAFVGLKTMGRRSVRRRVAVEQLDPPTPETAPAEGELVSADS
jgi:hypothetical protein